MFAKIGEKAETGKREGGELVARAVTRRTLLSGLATVGGGLAALAVLPSMAAADQWQRDLTAPPVWVETNTADVVLRTAMAGVQALDGVLKTTTCMVLSD